VLFGYSFHSLHIPLFKHLFLHLLYDIFISFFSILLLFILINLASELTGGTFNLAALQQMSRNDYHLSDEESSVGTHRDFMWGIVMGYFLGETSGVLLFNYLFI
jgi:predicted membrane-bound dolichyl-phosphate-mannose-protein mannosyltransferase